MFDNRWDNWAGDFAESFEAGQFDRSVRDVIPEILRAFGDAVRRVDRAFPDEVSPGTFASVLTQVMPRLSWPEAARSQVPEVIARFLESLQEGGRLGDGIEWAAEVRSIGLSPAKGKPGPGAAKGVTIRKPTAASAVGRNDPCPCGSGKKYKKCCQVRA